LRPPRRPREAAAEAAPRLAPSLRASCWSTASTRRRASLLGPCFKTGRGAGCRRSHARWLRPGASWCSAPRGARERRARTPARGRAEATTDTPHHPRKRARAARRGRPALVVRHPRPSLPSQHVQALLHSLSRVLCTFPSRYLSAIGLPRILSLGWGLPPASSCSPKQLDSSGRPLARSHAGAAPRTPRAPRGSHPPWRPLPRDLARAGPAGAAPLQATPRRCRRFSAWAGSLFTRRYWGSPRSFLFPPPTDMLKSGGSSCKYLALDGVYHPIRNAIPNISTL